MWARTRMTLAVEQELHAMTIYFLLTYTWHMHVFDCIVLLKGVVENLTFIFSVCLPMTI